MIPEPINSLPRRRTSLCATECSLCGEPPLQEELCRSLMASISRDRRKSSRSCVGNRRPNARSARSEEHTSELQSRENLVCRLLLEKKNKIKKLTRHVYIDNTSTLILD